MREMGEQRFAENEFVFEWSIGNGRKKGSTVQQPEAQVAQEILQTDIAHWQRLISILLHFYAINIIAVFSRGER